MERRDPEDPERSRVRKTGDEDAKPAPSVVGFIVLMDGHYLATRCTPLP